MPSVGKHGLTGTSVERSIYKFSTVGFLFCRGRGNLDVRRRMGFSASPSVSISLRSYSHRHVFIVTIFNQCSLQTGLSSPALVGTGKPLRTGGQHQSVLVCFGVVLVHDARAE